MDPRPMGYGESHSHLYWIKFLERRFSNGTVPTRISGHEKFVLLHSKLHNVYTARINDDLLYYSSLNLLLVGDYYFSLVLIIICWPKGRGQRKRQDVVGRWTLMN